MFHFRMLFQSLFSHFKGYFFPEYSEGQDVCLLTCFPAESIQLKNITDLEPFNFFILPSWFLKWELSLNHQNVWGERKKERLFLLNSSSKFKVVLSVPERQLLCRASSSCIDEHDLFVPSNHASYESGHRSKPLSCRVGIHAAPQYQCVALKPNYQ